MHSVLASGGPAKSSATSLAKSSRGSSSGGNFACWTEPLADDSDSNGKSDKSLSVYYVVPEPHFIEYMKTVRLITAKARGSPAEHQNDTLAGLITGLDAATNKAKSQTYFKVAVVLYALSYLLTLTYMFCSGVILPKVRLPFLKDHRGTYRHLA